MRLEVCRGLVVVLFVGFGLLSASVKHVHAKETSSNDKKKSLILHLDEGQKRLGPGSKSLNLIQRSASKRKPAPSKLQARLAELAAIRNGLPVEPWAPGRGSLGVKVNVSW
jgi:hypothetical protein